MAAKTTIKVATLSAAAKDDLDNLALFSATGGQLAVLANDPGSAALVGVYTDAGNMVNGATPTSQVKAQASVATVLGGTVTIQPDGTVLYTPPADPTLAARFLAAGAGVTVLTDSFSYVAQMSNGAMSLANVRFSIQGVNDVASISGVDEGSVTEHETTTAGGDLIVVDPDTGESFFQAGSQAGEFGTLAIDADGHWTYALTSHALWGDEQKNDTFTVHSLDGTAKTITVQVTGADDAAVIAGDDEASITEDTVSFVAGTLTVADLDHDQSAMQASTESGAYGEFALLADGTWTYAIGAAAQALRENESAIETFIVYSADETSHEVTVTVIGVNDEATFSGATTGDVTEDSDPSVGGLLVVTDVDHDEAALQADTQHGTWGTFVAQADGNWSYELGEAAQALRRDEMKTETFTVTSVDGNTQDIVVTVHGTNDDATITGDLTGYVKEDGVLLAAGDLNVSDADTGEAGFKAPDAAFLQGVYGSFTFDTDTGAWSYTLANDLAVVQGLDDADTRYDFLEIESLDGTARETIQIAVQGTTENYTTLFKVNHGTDRVNERNVILGFDANDRLEPSSNLTYVGAEAYDNDGNGSKESTRVLFQYGTNADHGGSNSGGSVGSAVGNLGGGNDFSQLEVILVGYTGFTVDANLVV